MLHKGTSLQYQNFVKLPPMLLKPLWMCSCCAFLASCSSTLNFSFHLLILSPEGLTDTSQYKWSLCAIMTALPPRPDCSHSHSQWGIFCRRECLLCLLIEASVHGLLRIYYNLHKPALAHLHQSNGRITPSTQTVTELLVKSASRLIGGSGQYFFSVKKLPHSCSPSVPKKRKVCAARCQEFLLLILDGLTPNLGISLIKVSSIFC